MASLLNQRDIKNRLSFGISTISPSKSIYIWGRLKTTNVGGNSYVYFALTGDRLDPQIITEKLQINPTEIFRKGDQGNYNPNLAFGCWKLSTDKGTEYLMIENLIQEIVSRLFDKIELINELKKQYGLNSVLEIVLCIDTNEEKYAPSLGYDLKTIEFLYRTQTITDVDIYRFNSLTES